ncbi:10548_t:CDS:1, partial [Funneliformis caledonium]
CNRTFIKQQGLIQHIQNRHPFIETEQKTQNNVNDDDLFQDEQLFKDLFQT